MCRGRGLSGGSANAFPRPANVYRPHPLPQPPEEKAAAGVFLSPMSRGWINLSVLRRTLKELGEAEEATGSGRCRHVRLGRRAKSLSQRSGDRGGGLRGRLSDRMADHFWHLQLPLWSLESYLWLTWAGNLGQRASWALSMPSSPASAPLPPGGVKSHVQTKDLPRMPFRKASAAVSFGLLSLSLSFFKLWKGWSSQGQPPCYLCVF